MTQAPDDPSNRTPDVTRGLQRILVLATELEREVARLLGVGPADYRALAALMRAGSLTVGELASAIGASYATTTALANRLEAAGRLRRERTDADHRKVRLRVVDGTAAEILALMRAPMDAVTSYVDGLPDADRRALAAFTADVAARLTDHLGTLVTTPGRSAPDPSPTTATERAT